MIQRIIGDGVPSRSALAEVDLGAEELDGAD
jgi:hypothetical protein